MGVTQGKDPYLVGLLLRDIDGQVRKRRHKNILRNVISVKDLHRIFTSLKEFPILLLALGCLVNEAWTLWDLSLKQ